MPWPLLRDPTVVRMFRECRFSQGDVKERTPGRDKRYRSPKYLLSVVVVVVVGSKEPRIEPEQWVAIKHGRPIPRSGDMAPKKYVAPEECCSVHKKRDKLSPCMQNCQMRVLSCLRPNPSPSVPSSICPALHINAAAICETPSLLKANKIPLRRMVNIVPLPRG